MTLSLSPIRATLVLAPVLFGLAACGGEEDPFAVDVGERVSEAPSARFSLGGAESLLGIEPVVAGAAELTRELELPGRVGFDEDRHAAVVARVEGVVSEARASLGERVEPGDCLAVLQSRELAHARSAYIAAGHRIELARSVFEREERLWKKEITAEESFLAARHGLEEARLELDTLAQALLALGVGSRELELVDAGSEIVPPEGGAREAASEATGLDNELTRFELRAPIAGTIVAKTFALGEVVGADATLFEVADLGHVWVDVRVRAADLFELEVGAPVEVRAGELGLASQARVGYLDPRLDPDTQTALARVVLPNDEGHWRPGLYVLVRAEVGRHRAEVSVPAASVHRIEGVPGESEAVDRVFVSLGGGDWEARVVKIGRVDEERCEVLEGLRAGERVALGGAVSLKSAWLGQGGLEE